MKRDGINFLKNKKGVSPIIATVLLIAMVVVLGLIIFLWFRGFTQESVTKFDTNVELVCGDVNFEASYIKDSVDPNKGKLSVINTGNVPIYRVKVKSFGLGSYSTRELSLEDKWPVTGLNQGDAFSEDLTLDSTIEEVTVIPVLMGNSKNGQTSFACNEDQYGFSMTL